MAEENTRTKELVKAAVEALKDKKGGNIRIIDIHDVSVVADYFIIADGANVSQVQALADNVEEYMEKAGRAEHKTEGYQSAGWILLDYGDIIIHIFWIKMNHDVINGEEMFLCCILKGIVADNLHFLESIDIILSDGA